MSQARFSVIPAWVVTDPRLKGRDLQVLCLLGRHTDRSGWCRRSQVKMAREIDVSRGTVQASLARLYELGVVEKHEETSADGRDSAHWYRVILDRAPPEGFAFDAWLEGEEEENISEASVSDDADDTPPANILAGGASSGLAPPASSGLAPINVPSLTPPDQRKEREGASARMEGDKAGSDEPAEDDDKQLLRRVKAMETGRGGKSWPGCEGSSTNWAVSQFAKLTAEERRQAEARRDAYLALCEAKKIRPVALGVYFRDRKFEGVAEAAREVKAAAKMKIPPLGPVWAGMKALALAAGPERISIPENIYTDVRLAYEAMARTSVAAGNRYLLNKGLRIENGELIFPPDFREQEIARRVRSHGYPEVNRLHEASDQLVCEARFAALAEMCEAVPEDSALYRAWREAYEAHGWPWKDCCVGKPGQRIAYFPKGGPDGFQAWVDAAKAAVDGGGAC